MIKIIDYNSIKEIKIETYGVDIVDRGIYYAYFINNQIASIINITENKYYYKMHCNYTFPEYRKKGYFTELLKYILKIYNDKTIKADCLESSYKIYEKLGFKKKNEKQFKKFKIYYMEKLNEEKRI